MSDIHVIAQSDVEERHKTLTEEDIEAAAKEHDIEVAAIKSVIAVESAGKGFLADGRPRILFEGHIFWQQLVKNGKNPEDYIGKYPEIVYKSWTRKFYKGGAKEYDRYKIAELIDKDAAKKSTSWGMFQIMGFNHQASGYDTVDAFVEDMSMDEFKQLKAFSNFCKTKGLIQFLRDKNWEAFALRYNGKGYKENKYDEKLETNYTKFLKDHKTDITVTLTRDVENEKQTQGSLVIMESNQQIFECKTLELPWKNNQRNISCIPDGTYDVEKRNTTERGDHFHVLNVNGRSSILIHSGNYYGHTLGCILVGEKLSDINKDGFADVLSSRITLAKMNDILPKRFKIKYSQWHEAQNSFLSADDHGDLLLQKGQSRFGGFQNSAGRQTGHNRSDDR